MAKVRIDDEEWMVLTVSRKIRVPAKYYNETHIEIPTATLRRWERTFKAFREVQIEIETYDNESK